MSLTEQITQLDNTTAAKINRESGDKPLNAWIRALAYTARIADDPRRILPTLLDELADQFGHKPALVGPKDALTYQDLAIRAHRYSRWALQEGIRPGDAVCLLMSNCADYVAIWLGISHIGGGVALINTNLRGHALLHSIGVVAPKHVIVGAAFEPAILEVMPQLPETTRISVAGPDSDQGQHLPTLQIDEFSGARLAAAETPAVTVTDRALYIYTSGTTGLPKAANISHYRLLEWSYWFAGMMDTQPEDRMYNCLPMYHSTGGIVAIGALLVRGGTVIIREKFSASQFWTDITSNECTLFQYIGELCRYLLNAPPLRREHEHRLRLFCGNGMRGDVWTALQQRFKVPRILEFYASTEGNVSLYNCEGKPGAIGRIPPFLATRFPIALIKCTETGNPVRNSAGLCVCADPDEAGEAIGRILEGPSAQMSAFDGYTDATASRNKILQNVFAAGDVWFRTGDLMRRDPSGFFYFVDRAGDTFRWKGENVSTAQVAEVVSRCPGVEQAVVFGISLPDTDGKAGMAALVVDPDFCFVQFQHHLSANLPEFAHPVLVRLCTSLPMTGTFKPITAQLAAEGYDPRDVADAMYVNDRAHGAFVPLDCVRYEAVVSGKFRL